MEITPAQELRQFTKKHAQNERNELARNITATRAPFFKRRETINRLKADQREIQNELSTYQDSSKQLHLELDTLSSSFISKHLRKGGIKGKEAQIDYIKQRLGQLTNEEQTISEDISTNEALQSSRAELKAAVAQRDEFYRKQAEQMDRLKQEEALKKEKEKQARQIPNIVKEYKNWKSIFFVHGIHPHFSPGDNTILREDVTWKDKLKIVLALQPHLSTSTVSEGYGQSSLWARIGVILKDGEITSASSEDAATQAVSLKQRTIKEGATAASIRQALIHFGRHNEITVQEPKVAGFYIVPKKEKVEGSGDDDNMPSDEEIASYVSDELGLPVYQFEEGRLHRAQYDKRTKKFIPGKESISSQEILDSTYYPSQELREKLLEEIMEDSPFKLDVIRSREGSLLMSRDSGREMYFRMNPYGFRRKFPAGKPIDQFITTNKSTWKFVLDNQGRLVGSHKTKGGSEFTHQVHEYDSQYVPIGPNTVKLRGSFRNNRDYIAGLEMMLADIQNGKEYDKLGPEIKNHLQKRIAFNLFGYGEEAAKLGDNETQTLAQTVASKFLPVDQYLSAIKRLGPNGEFRLYLQDLQELSD